MKHWITAGLIGLFTAPAGGEEMTLGFTPAKHQVYAGEALRLDVRWHNPLEANRLRELRCNPEFLTDKELEVVVPRRSIEEKEQLGMPFGGRRIIARRLPGSDKKQLGEVDFPLFLRFGKPGARVIDSVRLDCAYLKKADGNFAPYAAYFNNALFEPVDEDEPCDRLFTRSEPFEIEVLDLPNNGRTESFSGLFAPCRIDVSTRVREIVVGGILEVDLLVRTDAPHGMIELPDLSLQRSLRSWFKVDAEPGRRWHTEGTLFRLRVRPLTTRVRVFPSLEFQIFDPQSGEYRMLSSNAVPLTVLADDGREYFDVKLSQTGDTVLTSRSGGIRQNDAKAPMNDILNHISGWLADYGWLWLVLGPLMFLALLPLARERRRRATDPAYRKLVAAYREFLKLPEGDARKWVALRRFLAAGFGNEAQAWTRGDTRRKLREIGASGEDIDMVAGSQRNLDHEMFSEAGTPAVLPPVNGAGRRIFNLLAKLSLVAVMFGLCETLPAAGTDWDQAETAFAQALEKDPGSHEWAALFSEAALKFERAAAAEMRPGSSWYNAGNAWFQAGETGRAIACFRQAEIYRPFDPALRESLAAARALTVDSVDGEDARSWWIWPRRWLVALLVPVSIAFWITLLAHIRYRRTGILIASGVFAALALALASSLGWTSLKAGSQGVITAVEVQGRKGPSYRYQSAFHEALHDGLECEIVDQRDGWVEIRLSDTRRCWVPKTQVRPILNPW